MEDLTGQSSATAIDSTEWNNFIQEFKNLITPLSAMSNADLNQIRKSIASFATKASWVNCSGGPTSYTLSISSGMSAPNSYSTGQEFRFRPNVNNSVSSVTANVGGLGPISVVRESGSALQAGDLATTRDAVIRYNAVGPVFYVLDYSLAAGAIAYPGGYITGLTMGRDTSEGNNFDHVNVQPGSCRDFGDTMNIVNGSTFVKDFSGSWALGSGSGGLASGVARTAGAWYRFFAIGDTGSGSFDFGFDGSATASNLLSNSGYDAYRMLGWIKAKTSTSIEPFSNPSSDPSYFQWSAGQGFADLDRGGVYPSSGVQPRENHTLEWAPPSSTVSLNFDSFRTTSASGELRLMVTPTNFPDIAPSRSVFSVSSETIIGGGAGATPSTTNDTTHLGRVDVELDSSSEISTRAFPGETSMYVYGNTIGFRFER